MDFRLSDGWGAKGQEDSVLYKDVNLKWELSRYLRHLSAGEEWGDGEGEAEGEVEAEIGRGWEMGDGGGRTGLNDSSTKLTEDQCQGGVNWVRQALAI